MEHSNVPVPKPRSFAPLQPSQSVPPTPRPRHVVPPIEKADCSNVSDILTTFSSKSKQFTDGVAAKLSNSAKGTFEKTKSTSRAVRDTVTKSVIEGTTAGIKLLKSKKSENTTSTPQTLRCASMPDGDVNLFENISFISPLQRRYMSEIKRSDNEPACFHLNQTQFDDLSLFSSNSDTCTESFSDTDVSVMCGVDEMTYDTPRSSGTNSRASCMSIPCPEIPERKKKLDINIEKNRRNTCYENYQLPTHQTLPFATQKKGNEDKPRPSQSTIYEFDPLNASSTSPNYKGVSNELLLLESFLIGDTYGTVVATDHEEDILEYVENDYFNPPSPPERLDSLAELEPQETAVAAVDESQSSWYVTEDGKENTVQVEVRRSNSMMQKFSRKLRLDSVLHKSVRINELETNVVERPPINHLPAPFFSGTIMKCVSSALVEELFKTSQSRYCVLSDQKLVCYSDPTNSIVKEVHHLNSIYCVQVVLPLSSSATNTYSFELHVSTGPRVAPRKHVFTCNSVSERRNWVQKIAEHLASGFPPRYNAEYNRMGWCYMKEGVTGEWKGAWLMLVRRVLLYYTAGREQTLVTIDLRKTKCVVTQAATPEANLACPSDDSPHLLLDCPHSTIYLRFTHERLLKNWRYMIKLAAQTNGAFIHHQQLTKDDVPAIVEKCISFVYAYGSLSEGIYRRNGGNSSLGELLGRFRRDAWAVQLSAGEHSEHDVAGALKRFLRDLPEPLLAADHSRALALAIVLDDEASRFAEYRRVMLSLPLVGRQTARKLFAHLHFLHTMAHANKMNAENLASVWAPTIMPVPMTNSIVEAAWSSKEVFVVRDLIAHYDSIWESTEAEKRREGAMRKILSRVLSNSAPVAPRAAGDIRAWIYVKDKSACYQVALSPSKTSSDVCIELCEKANIECHMLMVEEVICEESMRRTVHCEEVVLDVVLRWGYWDEEDRKNNYLVVKQNALLYELDALKHNINLVCGELKIATEATKAFKLHMFELQHGCLCYFKDKQGSQKIDEWNMKDCLWYVGHEPRRSPQSRWAITLIPRNKQKRSKDKPWFGTTIAGAVNEDQLKWMSAMMFAEHTNILPTPRLVIT